MNIFSIDIFKSNKVKITTDKGIAFVLYKGDLVKYGLSVDKDNSKELEFIIDELLPKRALSRALKIVSERDMTERMLSEKLNADCYPEDIINSVIDKLKKERLINDERFIRGFIESKSAKKSKRDIMIALSSKVWDMNLCERLYDELKADDCLKDESELIKELLRKRHYDFENSDYEAKQKEIRYLSSKGFSYDSIHSALRDE
ncbi:MAG: regulatory protein RecX [Lachnospiraceae bacterium]|nr:regulatory protein RecX [Lachnospiraceae bacterium]MBP5565376.1 regulatory protein RecX [Lachnospiraceae bacterium]